MIWSDVAQDGGATRRDAAIGDEDQEPREKLVDVDAGVEFGEFGEEIGGEVFRWDDGKAEIKASGTKLKGGPTCVGPPGCFGNVRTVDGLPYGGFGFGRKLRNDAELLHKAQSVPVDIAFCHLAATEAGDAYSGDGELLPRWRNPAEIAFMGTPTGPTGHHCFALGNDVLDRQSKVGESSAVERRSLLLTLGAPSNIGCRGVMVVIVGGKEFICHRQIALVPKFFEQTTDDSFIFF